MRVWSSIQSTFDGRIAGFQAWGHGACVSIVHRARALSHRKIRQLALIAVALSASSQAASSAAPAATLAIGEYSPFVAQPLPEYGVTAAIVTAAFNEQGIQVHYDFLPWKRGYTLTLQGKYVGTFPYLKTPEREASFLYSEAIFTDRFRLFVEHSQQKQSNWLNKRVCVPLGYDTTQIEAFTTANQISFEQPPDIANCFKMLKRKRVDAVWVSELVAADTNRALFGADARTYPCDISLLDENKYYFIVSKTLPQAAQWMARFDAGLQKIRKNGRYAEILRQFGMN